MESMRQQRIIEGQGRTTAEALAQIRGHVPVSAGSGADPVIAEIVEKMVEQDVIPRLLLTRRTDAPPVAPAAPAPERPAVTGGQLAKLVQLVMAREEAASISYVESLHEAGVPTETLYLDLLAPTARQLGQMWVDDDCDFTDVTVGLFLLQNALRALGSPIGGDVLADPQAHRALLVPLPREQHTFGLSMVFDFFRRAGWNAWSGPIESDGELAAIIGGSWFDVVGLSLACDEQLDEARRVIRLVRRASLNPDVAVMVGGPGLTSNPDLSAQIGADGTAIDGLQAVRHAEALVAQAASRRCS